MEKKRTKIIYHSVDLDGVASAAIARSFGGGGHAKAAGFQLDLRRFTDFLRTREL